MANKRQKSTVDCSKLSEGMIVKNYKQLCELLGEREMGGDSKPAQLRRWQRYFRYEQSGHKFAIIKIYQKPLPNTDKRKDKPGKYLKYVEYLLMGFLLRQEGCCAVMAQHRWWQCLGMTNENFNLYLPYNDKVLSNDNLEVSDVEKYRFSDLIKRIAEKYNLPIADIDIDYFYNIAQGKLREILNNALKSMENRRLIRKSSYFEICMQDGSRKIVTDSDEETIKEILSLQRQTLERMGLEKYSEAIVTHQTHKYYENLQALVQEKHTIKDCPDKSWKTVYEFTKIIFLRESIKQSYLSTTQEFIKSNTPESKCQKRLNGKVVIALNGIVKDKKVKENKRFGEFNPMKNNPESAKSVARYYNNKFDSSVQSKDNFIEIQNSLIDYLISIDN